MDDTIHDAAARGDIPAIEAFLAAGVDVNSRRSKRTRHGAIVNDLTPLMEATGAVEKSVETMRFLLKHGADLAARSDWEESILHHASKNQNSKAISFLLDLGLDLEARSWNGSTPLKLVTDYLPFSESQHLEGLRVLIQRGADVDAIDGLGQTVLHSAARFGLVACARLLVDAGAKIDVYDDRGMTPLVYAKAEVAAILLAAGADPWLEVGIDKSELGESELQQNSPRRPDNAILRACWWDLPELLVFVDQGVDLFEVERRTGECLLATAINLGRFRIAWWLLAHGFDMSAVRQRSMLIGEAISPEQYSDEFVHVALAAGAQIEARDKNGYTPLLNAAKTGYAPILRALLAHGADPGAALNGENALAIIQRERKRTIEFYETLPSEKRLNWLEESRLRASAEVEEILRAAVRRKEADADENRIRNL